MVKWIDGPVRRWMPWAMLMLPVMAIEASGGTATEPTVLSVDIRGYFFQRNFDRDSRDMEDPALGGILRLRKGLSPDLDLGLALYVSDSLGFADDDKAVYGLLGKGAQGEHRDYAGLGEAFVRYRRGGSALSFGRQPIRSPWVNPHDVRMTPNAFESLLFTHRGAIADFTLAHATRMKRKNETRFRPMSDHVVSGSDEPLTLAGLRYDGIPGTRLQLWDYLAHRMWNDVYLRVDRHWRFAGGPQYWAILRFLKRDSLGEALAGPLDTYHTGIEVGAKLGGFGAGFAWSRNGEQGISRVWGHDMTISNQVYVADRAREQALKFSVDYRFGAWGWPGLRAGLVYSVANTPDDSPSASPDRGELNLDLSYEFGASVKGLSLRARYATIKEWGSTEAQDVDDIRLYCRYRREW